MLRTPVASMTVSPPRYTCLISISLIAVPPSRWPWLFALHPHASLHLYLLACISLIYLHLIDMTMHVMELAAHIRLMPLPCGGEFGSAQAMPPTVWR